MKDITLQLADHSGIISETLPEVDTIGGRDANHEGCEFFLNATVLTGVSPSMLISIVSTIDGAEHEHGTFVATTTVPDVQRIQVPKCPANVQLKIVQGGTSVATFTAKVSSMRF